MLLENQGQWTPARWTRADGFWINDGGHSYRNPGNAFALPRPSQDGLAQVIRSRCQAAGKRSSWTRRREFGDGEAI